MTELKPLSKKSLFEQLGKYSANWIYTDQALHKTYHFDDYQNARDFVDKVGEVASNQDHHPTVVLKYDQVEVTTTTHKVGDVTIRDIELITQIEKINLD